MQVRTATDICSINLLELASHNFGGYHFIDRAKRPKSLYGKLCTIL
jgi:hypothetical protein